MEQFDKMLKEMAEKEECIVPDGFDQRLKDVLGNLPPRAKKRGLGAVKGALIAAAVCAALMGTALAASPGLREILGASLGGFAPYAQEQVDKTYVMDGFEVKVLSALSDGSTLRAYVQVRDLEGDRLGPEMEPWGAVDVLTEEDKQGGGTFRSFSVDSGYAVYDEESKTALLVFTSWAQGFGDLKNAKLEIRHIYDYQSHVEMRPVDPGEWEGQVYASEGVEVTVMEPVTPFVLNDVQLTIPLQVESMPRLTFGPDTELAAGIHAESVELSPLGLTAMILMENGTSEVFMEPVRARMADGTEVKYDERNWMMPTGQGTYIDQETGKYGWIYVWNFPDALDLEQVEGVYVGGAYYPVK